MVFIFLLLFFSFLTTEWPSTESEWLWDRLFFFFCLFALSGFASPPNPIVQSPFFFFLFICYTIFMSFYYHVTFFYFFLSVVQKKPFCALCLTLNYLNFNSSVSVEIFQTLKADEKKKNTEMRRRILVKISDQTLSSKFLAWFWFKANQVSSESSDLPQYQMRRFHLEHGLTSMYLKRKPWP